MPGRPKTQSAHPARVSALIYGGISVIAAVAFILVTTLTGDYPAVARYGGAAWVFLLLMIVLMPLVIPRVQKRGGTTTAVAAEKDGAKQDVPAACPMSEATACPIEADAAEDRQE